MSNRNNINSRLNKVNKQLLKLNGNNGGLNLKGLKSKLSLSNSSASGGSKKVFIVIGVILLLVILGVGGYFLYRYFKNRKVFSKSKLLIPYIHDAQIDKLFSNSSIPKSASGNEYNINMWIYVNDYNYRHDNDKCILIKIDSKHLNNSEQIPGIDDTSVINNGNPSIWLRKNENTLVVATGLDTLLDTNDCSSGKTRCNGNGGKDNDKCEIKNFPLQRWVNVNVSLRNNVLDIFMDGSLKKSCILTGSPTANAGDVHVLKTGTDQETGFNGYLSKLEFTNKALSTDQIMKRYKKGPTVKVSKGFLNIFK
jgi:hypothetical protein